MLSFPGCCWGTVGGRTFPMNSSVLSLPASVSCGCLHHAGPLVASPSTGFWGTPSVACQKGSTALQQGLPSLTALNCGTTANISTVQWTTRQSTPTNSESQLGGRALFIIIFSFLGYSDSALKIIAALCFCYSCI